MNILENYTFGDSVNATILYREKIKFCLSLHNKCATRNCVQEIVERVDFFIVNLLVPFLNQEIKKVLDSDSYYKVKHILDSHKSQFKNFSTEKQRFKIFRKDSIYVDPIEFRIGDAKVKTLLSNAESIIELKPAFATRIPLGHTLKIFFELPGFYEEITKYVESLKKEENVISNFIQAKLWTTKYKDFSHQPNTYPLFLFFDDFETGCALGTAAGLQKLGGIYTSIPCLPPHIVAKMYCMFLSAVVYSTDREEFRKESAFSELICEFNYLRQNGLTINVNNKNVTLFFNAFLC